MRIDKEEYIERRTSKGVYRNWYIVKSHTGGSGGETGVILLNKFLYFPKKYIGKKFKIKLEEIK